MAQRAEGADTNLVILPIDTIELGATVEVRRRFDHAWATGFEIADSSDDGYQLRRRSDGALLPVTFPAVDVRRSSSTAAR